MWKKKRQRKYRDTLRETEAYKKARNNVLRRDKHRCQFPNCKRRAKQVHHILEHATHVATRLTESNMISLCYLCHKKITGKESHYASMFLEIAKENGK